MYSGVVKVFDLIIRDATIVSACGRQVADVAVRDGRIAYVGPRPPRGAREEISAIGKFLMPGVVDTAVQFDPDPSQQDVWERESAAAVSGGVTTVLALPHGDAPVVDEASARHRFERASRASWCDFGLWASARQDNREELFGACEQGLVTGVLARLGSNDPDAITPDGLQSWLNLPGRLGVQLATQPGSETETLLATVRQRDVPTHLVHLSTSSELDLIDPVRGDLPITAGVTPHHLFLSSDDGEVSDVHTHPPLRPEHDRRTLWTAIKRGRLDCVASDHHPSSTAKRNGVPGSELLLPLMMSAVKHGRLSLELLVSMCSEAPARIFNLPNKGRIRKGADADLVLFSEAEVTRVAPGSLRSGANWSPYVEREAAPKPDFVFVAGQLVAEKGELMGKCSPQGRHVGATSPIRAA